MEKGERKEATSAGPRLKRLLCRRTGEWLEPEKHELCPYCFGDLDDVGSGHHEAFCDYHEGVDPVRFGFPGDDARSEQG